MANPVLVEVTRGRVVESRHRGAISVRQASGKNVWSVGQIDQVVFPRSGVKALQALPLVESGAADAFGFSDAELALACSSHNGEPDQVETARSMLRKIGLDEKAFACGPSWPMHEEDRKALVRAGGDQASIYNDCSGKHSGMLALALHLGASPLGYEQREHIVQQTVRTTLEEMTGTEHTMDQCGGDGCSIPTYAVPLDSLALAFARFITGDGLSKARSAASGRLMKACLAHPDMVAGKDRFCTRAMEALAGRVFVKTGAEGVFCAGVPELGLGIALKCDDGTTRASEAMMAGTLLKLIGKSLTEEQNQAIGQIGFPSIVDRRENPVGVVRWKMPS